MVKSLLKYCLCTSVLGTIFSFVSCSVGTSSELRNHLKNQGPVVVTNDNPYLVTSVFLAKESEQSPSLKGFLATRGNPSAFELRKKWLSRHQLFLFYLDRNEVYLLEEAGPDWLVQGPARIPEKVLASLPRSELIETSIPAPRAKLSPEPAPAISNTVPRTALPAAKQTAPVVQTEKEQPSSQTNSRLTVSPSGDIVHRVSFPGETLRMIANWYTGDVENVDRIVGINGLSDPNFLAIGQEILLPRYLLKRTDPIPEKEVNFWLKSHVNPGNISPQEEPFPLE